jgi:hypothetical protein
MANECNIYNTNLQIVTEPDGSRWVPLEEYNKIQLDNKTLEMKVGALVHAIRKFRNNTDSGEDEYCPFVSNREAELYDIIKPYDDILLGRLKTIATKSGE